jgi:hypothetical protein
VTDPKGSRKSRPADPDAPVAVDVEAWGHHRAQWITLPSGAGKILFQPTSLQRAILGGYIPDAGLEEMARRVVMKGFDPEDPEITDEQWSQYENFRDWLIADGCKEPKVAPEFVRQALEDDGAPHMPFEDRQLLWVAAQHGVPAARALNTEGNQVEELMRTILDLSPFRDGASGPAAAEDGKGAGGASE